MILPVLLLFGFVSARRNSDENIAAVISDDTKLKQAEQLLKATDLKSGNLTAKQQQDVAAAQKLVKERRDAEAAKRKEAATRAADLKKQRDALEEKKKSGRIKSSEVGKLRNLRFEKRKQDAHVLFLARVEQARLEKKRSEGTQLTQDEERNLTSLAVTVAQAEEKLQKRAQKANEGLKQAEQELRDLKNSTKTDKKTKWAKFKRALEKMDKMHELLLSDAKQQVKQLTAIKEKFGLSDAQEKLLAASSEVVRTVEEAREKKRKMEQEIAEKAKKKVQELKAKKKAGQSLNVTEKEKLKRAEKKVSNLRRKEKMAMMVRLSKLNETVAKGKKLTVKQEEEKKKIEEQLKAWKSEKKERKKKEQGKLAAAEAQTKALKTVKTKSTKQKHALDQAREWRQKKLIAKIRKLESKLRRYKRQRFALFSKVLAGKVKQKLNQAKAELKKLEKEIAEEEAAARQVLAAKAVGEMTKAQRQARAEAEHTVSRIEAAKLKAAKKKLARILKKGGNQTAKAETLQKEIATLKQHRKDQKQNLKSKIQKANETIRLLKQQKATGAKLTDTQKRQLSQAKKTLQLAESKLLKARQDRVSRLMKKAEKRQLTTDEKAKLQKAQAKVKASMTKLSREEQADDQKLQSLKSEILSLQKRESTLSADELKKLQKLTEKQKKLESRGVKRQRTKISVLSRQVRTAGNQTQISRELEKAKTKKAAGKAQLELSAEQAQSGPKRAAKQFYSAALDQQRQIQAEFLKALKEEREKLSETMSEMIPGKMDRQSREAFQKTAKRLDEMLFYLKALAKAKVPKTELDDRLKRQAEKLQARVEKQKRRPK